VLNQQERGWANEPASPATETRDAPADERGTAHLLLAVYEQHGAALYGYIRRILGSAPDAEDVVQESVARALVWMQGLDLTDDDEGRQRCKRWLFQVATNISLDLLRRRKRGPLRFWEVFGRRQPEPGDEGMDEDDSPWRLEYPGWLLPCPHHYARRLCGT
jgi:DNA-directed RNA polymerase specialized sigma24 family protein